jgi:hypothetical protein
MLITHRTRATITRATMPRIIHSIMLLRIMMIVV